MYHRPNTIRQLAIDFKEQKDTDKPGKDPYLRGYYAAKAGKPLLGIPYRIGTEERKLWIAGWLDAQPSAK
jgi:ribosome modulation factor